jgi:hypothetical protein
LVNIKKNVDPANVFRNPQSIPVAIWTFINLYHNHLRKKTKFYIKFSHWSNKKSHNHPINAMTSEICSRYGETIKAIICYAANPTGLRTCLEVFTLPMARP